MHEHHHDSASDHNNKTTDDRKRMRPMGTVGSVWGLLEGLRKLRKKNENQNLRLAGYLPKRSLHR